MSKLRAKYTAKKCRVVLGSGVTGPSAEYVEANRKRSVTGGFETPGIAWFIGSIRDRFRKYARAAK